ncbi:MAG: hypothetical protein WCD86_22500 [Ktedonobacteraceae bacterium]
MTMMNYPSDQPSPETARSVSTPTVEWMPLDGIVQAWADVARQTTNERAFAAASLAFTALEQETTARRLYALSHQEAWPAAVQDALTSALCQLTDAASSWLSACDRLGEYRTVYLPDEEEPSEQAVLSALAAGYRQLLHVAQLTVRLIQEISPCLDEPVRVLVGQMSVPEREVSR